MHSHARITIAGLGPGAPGCITLGTWESLKLSPRVLLRTGIHPVVEWLRQEGISFSTFDYIYEEETDFQKIYKRIATRGARGSGKGSGSYTLCRATPWWLRSQCV